MPNVRLREDIALRFLENGDCEVHGKDGFKMKSLSEAQSQLLDQIWLAGIASESIASYSKEESDLIQLFAKRKMLRLHSEDFTRDEIWLSHFVEDPRRVTKLLSEKCVLIVGNGGTGSIVADHLARAGVGRFILVDGGLLDAPDLNRQLPFQRAEIGGAKAELLARHLKENLGVKTAFPHVMFLNSEDDFVKFEDCHVDLVINCADTPKFKIEELVLKLALRLGSAVVQGSVGINDYLVGPVLTTPAEIKIAIENTREMSMRGFKTRIMKGSTCFLNTMASAKLSYEAYRFLSGVRDPLV